MNSALLNLYELCDIDIDSDEPVLFIDDETAIYFEEAETGLLMTCPVSVLPNDPQILRRILQYDCASSVRLAADPEGDVLLALMSISEESSQEELITKITTLVNAVYGIREGLGLSINMNGD